MGLLNLLARPFQQSANSVRRSSERICQFEQLEPRIALSANAGPEIVLGAVYEEQSAPESAGDRFEIAWVGGGANTELTTLTISGDQDDNGFDQGDVFFDHDGNAPGVDDFSDFFVIAADSDITAAQITNVTVTNGGADLVLTIDGWAAGDKLVFTIDVDEQDDVPNSQVEGIEFQLATVTATFTSMDGAYTNVTGGGRTDGEFFDEYTLDSALNGLLPPDGNTGENDPTAGASFSAVQSPSPVAIEGYVYHDEDLDEFMDSGEGAVTDSSGNPIPVTLQLWHSDDGINFTNTGQTTQTDANGFYSFTHDCDGYFRIIEEQPGGYFSTTPDQVDTGYVGPGATSTGNKFGEALPGTLSGHVFEDDNYNDSFQSGTEAGIVDAQVTLTAFDASGNMVGSPTATTTTTNGFYQFTDLDPTLTYTITETQPPPPASPVYFDAGDHLGTLSGNDSVNDVFSEIMFTSSGQSGFDYDFGEVRAASITGFVYEDRNDDGQMDPNPLLEPGIADVTINLLDENGNPALDQNNNPITTKTNGDGFFRFDNLDPRETYGLEEEQPSNYADGQDQVGDANGTIQNDPLLDRIVGIDGLQPGVESMNYKFGELPLASISGFVYEDRNDDGSMDPNPLVEPGIEGVELRLLDANGNYVLDANNDPITTMTDVNGFWRFDGLDPNQTYGVEEVQPTDYLDGQDQVGAAGGTIQNDPLLDRIVGINNLQPGVESMNYKFGELPYASISGYVYQDRNNDGSMDPDPNVEPPIPHTTIVLLNANGDPVLDANNDPITTMTDANGFFRFEKLDPRLTYGLRELQPDGFFDGKDQVGTAGGTIVNDELMDEILGINNLQPGIEAVNYKFGELPPASISGMVFVDQNLNDQMEGGEPGIPNVTISITDENNNQVFDIDGNLIASTTTAGDGTYRFDGLDPRKTYTLHEVQPTAYDDGAEIVGTHGGQLPITDNDQIILINALLPGQEGANYKFGEIEKARISGYVFQDGPPIVLPSGSDPTNINVAAFRNGLRTPDDTPLVGVTLLLGDGVGNILTDGGGNPITAVTNTAGFYQFTGLSAGVYTVYQQHPTAYTDGIDTPGSHGGTAANPGNLGHPDLIGIPHNVDAIAKINLGRGEHALENNFSEVVVTVAPPPEDPPEDPPQFPPPPPRNPTPQFNDPSQLGPGPGLTPPLGAPLGPNANVAFYGGGPEPNVAPSVAQGYSFHLSVVDGGEPRGEFLTAGLARQDLSTASSANLALKQLFNQVFVGMNQGEGKWVLAGHQNPQEVEKYAIGSPKGIPISGDFDGDGISEVGVYRDGEWFIDSDGDGQWDGDDLWAKLGTARDLPVVGDWDGDGKTDIGIYGPQWASDPLYVRVEVGLPDRQNDSAQDARRNHPELTDREVPDAEKREMIRTDRGELRKEVIDHVFWYGATGDKPVAGDWNGDGVATIGVFSGGVWMLDDNGDGRWLPGETRVEFGDPEDVPVVGDWDGDGIDDVGVFKGGTWVLDSDGNRGLDPTDDVKQLGGPGDQPVVGDWDGDGRDDVGLYRQGGNVQREGI